jgi:hypothetical protein
LDARQESHAVPWNMEIDSVDWFAAAEIQEPPKVRIASKVAAMDMEVAPASGQIAIVIALGQAAGRSNGPALAGSIPVARPSPLTHAGN